MPRAANVRKQLENVQTHAHHMRIIREGTHAARKHVLKTATPNLVRALATVTRAVHEQGYEFPKHHQRRAHRLMSPSVSLANKKILVSGKPGTHSHGAGFFQDVGHAFESIAPHLTKVGNDIGHAVEKTAKDIGHAIEPWVKHAAHDIENRVHDFERVIQKRGGLKKILKDMDKATERELEKIGKAVKKHGPQALKMVAPAIVGMAATAEGGPMAGAAASAATKALMAQM